MINYRISELEFGMCTNDSKFIHYEMVTKSNILFWNTLNLSQSDMTNCNLISDPGLSQRSFQAYIVGLWQWEVLDCSLVLIVTRLHNLRKEPRFTRPHSMRLVSSIHISSTLCVFTPCVKYESKLVVLVVVSSQLSST